MIYEYRFLSFVTISYLDLGLEFLTCDANTSKSLQYMGTILL